MKTTRKQVVLPNETLAALERIATGQETTVSAVIRKALAAYIKEESGEDVPYIVPLGNPALTRSTANGQS